MIRIRTMFDWIEANTLCMKIKRIKVYRVKRVRVSNLLIIVRQQPNDLPFGHLLLPYDRLEQRKTVASYSALGNSPKIISANARLQRCRLENDRRRAILPHATKMVSTVHSFSSLMVVYEQLEKISTDWHASVRSYFVIEIFHDSHVLIKMFLFLPERCDDVKRKFLLCLAILIEVRLLPYTKSQRREQTTHTQRSQTTLLPGSIG